MKNDNLTICPHCGGDACYENKVTDEITTWHCFGCGFCSNTLMKEGEEFFDEQLSGEIIPFPKKNGKTDFARGGIVEVLI